jgi:hypothetical protein
MNLINLVKRRIKKYKPKGGLGNTALVIVGLFGINHSKVNDHNTGIVMLAEAVAKQLGKDEKLTFFAAVFHDMAKLTFNADLFNGREITREEYENLKRHAFAAFTVLKDVYLLTALCAGLHHAMYENGYGVSMKDFPKFLGPRTAKKALEIAMILAICDDIDASLHRKTKIMNNSGANLTLAGRLEEKFPDDIKTVKIALNKAEKIFKVKI